MVPLTLADFTLTIITYIGILLSLCLGFVFGVANAKPQNPIGNYSIFYRIVKQCFLAIVIFLVAANLFVALPKNVYMMEPIFFCFIGVYIVIYYNINAVWYYMLLFIIICLSFGSAIKRDIISLLTAETSYLHEDNQKYKLLRTLEKGFLVVDKDDSVIFFYLDGETKIEFQPNTKLVEYLNSLEEESQKGKVASKE